MAEKFYITTPIYYPSGNWHLGHCYTTVCADAIARFKRLDGYDVYYLTGTDEHGQKIEKKAQEAGVTPQAFVDVLAANIKELWAKLGISYDGFIRTTDESHVKAVQGIFRKLYEQGDIYKSEYKGLYCTPCESFWTESQLVDGKCPDCGRPVQETKEEAYFFRLSKYAPKIRELLKETDFLRPESRVNEMINNFIDAGLEDLCVSRTTFKWGVPVDFDEGHIVYVWVDALTNYITALGYGSEHTELYEKYWPADVHVMAKEIVRFHSIIWPAILIALGLPLPKKVFGHGWLMFGGDKMSKSKGNVVDPFALVDHFGVDAIRYYLLGCLPYGQDGQYSTEMMIGVINTDLANNIGNLVSRTTAMVQKYFGGVLPAPETATEFDAGLEAACAAALPAMRAALDDMHIPSALKIVTDLGEACNKYIDNTMPWALAKDESKRGELASVMYHLTEAIRFLGVLLRPFLIETPDRIFAMIGAEGDKTEFASLAKFGGLAAGTVVTKGAALFARIDAEAMLDTLEQSKK